ncbi:MAG TPA: FAD-dependent oxidoreductase [Thermomicrobiaceae bacterium]|nr:FAD-dependent oxidoreductase [Thermomicrobiaceae bacterium]
MSTVSIWQDTSIWPGFPTKHEQIDADVCIIGAGIVGGTLATFLSRAGKSAVVMEARDVGLGASGRNAGHVSVPMQVHYASAIERLGRDTVMEACRLGFRNREIIKGFLDDYGVWYEQPGSMAFAWDEEEAKQLAASARQMQADGYEVEFFEKDPTGREFAAALYRPGNIATQSYWLVTEVLAHSGARVIPNCAVFKIEQSGGTVTVHGQRATVRAAQVCLCTNAYSRTLHPYFADKVLPTRAQMLATAPTERFTELMMGCEWGYEYFRQLPDGRFLIGGWRNRFPEEEVGYNDYETTPHLQAGLESFLQKYFPELNGLPVEHRWSGIMGFTPDEMPLIGRLPDLPNVYFAVGFTGGGMGIGAATAERCAELMLHGTNPGIFSAERLG